MPNGAVTSPNGAVTPQSDSFLGMLLELLKGRWTEREEQTGQPMGIQNVAALSALEFLKPPQKMVPTKNPKLSKMGLKEEMNPAYLEMIAMGTMGKPKGVSGPKTPAIKQTSIKDIIQEGIDEYPSTDAADSHVSKLMQYIRSGEKLPPIVVSPSKYLSDGRHRLEAYRRLGYKKVPTVEGYHVGTSSVTTKSGKKIPLEKVSVEGQEFLRKVKKAQVSKPSAPKNLDERKEFFNKEIAQAQRGVPETKMVELQHVAGGGPISHVSESVGDLIDRIYGTPQKHGGRGWAWEATHEKINRSLATLEDAYGFKRWVSENATANAKAQGISIEQYKKGVDRALKEYADAHRNIPTYNKVQKLANDAAVAFGEKNFDLTIKNLKILRNYMDEGFESWEKRVYSLSRK